MDDYVAAVEQAGAAVRVIDVSASPRQIVAEIDALLLTGGGDVDPVLYGAERHPSTEDAEPGRDELEIDLARRAMAADLPILAICRGAQVLNVASGGTLLQHIPADVPSPLEHTIRTPGDARAHEVRVEPGSQLRQALGGAVTPSNTCAVNSRHHQAVARLGAQLAVSATAPDGVVEGIEKPGARFCLGVQWHPENFWRTGEFGPLFDAFVAAARR
ncbi:MAG TPA: gamma-glutamyl-gamma-aminobutyrate hydrolase family protein [Vicinamibacterales bacterium]|nr:gamma-glutamyl-gamma-aminobutyrate hydrolase family protein [Vicinamibacterales bacterium]